MYSSLELDSIKFQLDEYYSSVSDYTAFFKPSSQNHCWIHISAEIRKRSSITNSPIKVLEVGAGKSGFGLWLNQQGLRKSVSWSAQDVTLQNREWLEDQADKGIFGDVNVIEYEKYDIIFSTYVLEHIARPSNHLEYLYRLLEENGSLFIFSPRYDFPGYFCPSSRHISNYKKIKVFFWQQIYRIRGYLKKEPSFLIQNDLAAFHGPFFTDADAVHWVSLFDLNYWTYRIGAKFRILNLGSSKILSKEWIVKKFLTCAVEIRKGS